jgi:hypothetical protein
MKASKNPWASAVLERHRRSRTVAEAKALVDQKPKPDRQPRMNVAEKRKPND